MPILGLVQVGAFLRISQFDGGIPAKVGLWRSDADSGVFGDQY